MGILDWVKGKVERPKVEEQVSSRYQTGARHWSRRRCKWSGKEVTLYTRTELPPFAKSDRQINCPGCNREVIVLGTMKIQSHLPKSRVRNG